MSGEIQLSYQAGASVYALLRDGNGRIYSSSGTGGFGSYVTAAYSTYPISLTEQGVASAYYTGNWPSSVGPGIYNVLGKRQVGGSPAETDPTIAAGEEQWNGSALFPLSDLATSGQLGQLAPLRPARGVMITPFMIYLKSAADHITPLTSGIVSGQIARDNGSFGPLQSGAFTEVGLGWYRTTLTSGDLLANTVALNFSATGADPLNLSFILQRVSGVA